MTSAKTTEGSYVLLQQLLWVVLVPIAAFLGYNPFIPIDSPVAFWTVLALGIGLIISSSVPIKYEYDPSRDEFHDQIAGKRMSRQKVVVSRDIGKGLGMGFVAYTLGYGLRQIFGVAGSTLGEAISTLWTTWELYGAIIGIVAIVFGFRSLFLGYNKYTGRSAVMTAGQFDSLGEAPKYYNMGVDAKKAEEYDRATANFLEAARIITEMTPGNERLADIYYQIGSCYFRRWDHDYELAIEYFTKAVEIDAVCVKLRETVRAGV